MNQQELEQKVQRLENALGLLLEAVGDQLSPSEVREVQEALNPPKKLTERQQEAEDSALLKAWFGPDRYEREFAHLSAGEKARERFRVYG